MNRSLRSFTRPIVCRALPLLCALWPLFPAAALAQAPTPRPEVEPAMLGGAEPMLAFSAADGHEGAHVWVAAPAYADAREVGPDDSPGVDGAPTLVRDRGRAPLVAASRRHGNEARIWARVREGLDWSEPVWLRGSGVEDVQPRLATGGGRTWIAWSSLHDSGDVRLMVAEWNGRGFEPPETVPTGSRQPARPAIAVGADGLPVVAWSAMGPGDADIWLARRGARGWRHRQRVTRNGRHDLAPDLAVDGERIVVAWESLEPTGYHPWSTTLSGLDPRPAAAARLDRRPGAAPRLASDAEGVVVAWAAPDPSSPRATALRTARLGAGGWRPARELARARNARLAVASDGGGWLLGWHDDFGISAARVDAGSGTRLEPLRGVVRSGDAPIEISLPGTYLAFGDSITAGLVRFDGVISFVDGYSVHLGRMISDLIGTSVVVDQQAVPGELSSEAVNRLRAEMLRRPRQFVFINEGANDLANLVFGEVVRDNLVEMARSVRDADGLPLVGTVLPRNEGGFVGGINDRIEYANDLIRSGLRPHAFVVDLWAAFYRKPQLYSDHIHPDAAGYEVMGGVWFRELIPVLNDLIGDEDIDGARVEDEQLVIGAARPDRHQ